MSARDPIVVKIQLIRAIRVAVHVGAVVGLARVACDRLALAVGLSSYAIGMFAVTVGYHRYFAHRAFKTSRAMQLILAVLAASTLQRGVLWWAAVHREHHRRADLPGDHHSPREGLWHAHWSWLDRPSIHALDHSIVADLARFAELRALDRLYYLPALAWGLICAGLGALVSAVAPELGPRAAQFFVYGFLLRTVLVWHVTFAVNSVAHVVGWRRYETPDTSRNWLPLALISFGEGWHNNHHRFPTSARNGFFPGEVDASYALLRVLEALGLVWELRPVPAHVLAEGAESAVPRSRG